MTARRQPARERIIGALPAIANSVRRVSLLDAGDIAFRAGVAESTVRRHLPSLITDGYLQHTSYVGLYAITAKGAQQA